MKIIISLKRVLPKISNPHPLSMLRKIIGVL